MIRKLPVLIISWAWINSIVCGQDMTVGVDSPACNLNTHTLICNYTAHTKVVHLNQQLPKEIETITIIGAKTLMINDDFCTNITLRNIENVILQQGLQHICLKGISLTAKNSTIGDIPNHVKILTIEKSFVRSVTATSLTQEILVTNSHVYTLNLEKMVRNGRQVAIINSTIGELKQLQLSKGSELFVEDSSVTVQNIEGLVLTGVRGRIKNSIINTSLQTRIYMGPETILDFEGVMGKFTLQVMDKTNLIKEFLKNDSLDENDGFFLCNSYFWPFIVCIIFLILTFFLSMCYIVYLKKLINHINRQMPNPDMYDYKRDINNFLDKHIVEQKDRLLEDAYTDKSQQPHQVDIDMEQYQCILEKSSDLSEQLQYTLQAEKQRHEDNVNEFKDHTVMELEKLEEISRQKRAELENSKRFELQALEAAYEDEFSNPTVLFWEKVEEVLEKAKAFNIELTEEKYAHWLYNARIHNDVNELQEKVNIVRVNKEFITIISTSLKENLNQWPKILSMMRKTNITSNIAINLLALLETLVFSQYSNAEQNYDRLLREQDNKYLTDSEEQQHKLSEICSKLMMTNTEEKENLLIQMSKDLESKLPWTKKYTEEVENFYNIRGQLIDTKLDFEIKKAEDDHSEVQLKLLHLNVILEIQKEYMMNLEGVTIISVQALSLCIRTLRLGIYDDEHQSQSKQLSQTNSEEPVSGVSSGKDLFMDRFAQA